MLENYLPVLIFMAVGIGFGLIPVAAGFLLGPRKPDSEKLSPYECGFEAFEDTRMKFDVRYYLVAILFLLFDVEAVFLYPWAVVYRDLGLFGLVEMGIFLTVLLFNVGIKRLIPGAELGRV